MRQLTREEALKVLKATSIRGTARELKTFVEALSALVAAHGEPWVAEHRHSVLFGWKTIAVY